jgi:ABC-type polysaccharide/polyol phosphate export permease
MSNRNVANFKNDILEVIRYRYALNNLVGNELKIKYQRSVLGFFWSLLHPLLTMIVTSIVFSYIMRFELKQFVIFLFSGLLPFNFCSISINQCSTSIINNEGFIKKIYLPKLIFPLTVIFSNFVNFILSMTCLFIMGLFVGLKITPALLFLPVSVFLCVTFAIGGGLITATSVVFYRDLAHIYDVILQTLFYATPVLYPLSFMPEKYHYIFKLNPFFYIVEMFRQPIYNNRIPDNEIIFGAFLVSFTLFYFGFKLFTNFQERFVFRL